MASKIIADTRKGFEDKFNQKPEHLFFSPGRINLIGEHTDYNGGHVFPCAITLGIYAAVGKSSDNEFHLFSANFNDEINDISSNQLTSPKQNQWTDYFTGMAQELIKAGLKINGGLNIYIDGDLPNSSGLSSSAALELLCGTILSTCYHLSIDMLELVKAGQRVENNYLGLNTGIMDQFAIGMGKKNQATLLDTNTMKYEYLPIDLGDNLIVIMNTCKPRALVESKYNERRKECEDALKLLQTKLSIKSLGDLTNEQFDEYSYLIYDPILIKRARHAVSENQRTLKAAEALKSHQLAEFGRLISASGVSLAYDYEVTGKELDTLVKTALKQEGVFGSRMTGAGFGGCAIAIVNQDHVDEFKKQVQTAYTDEIGHPAEFYLAKISDGPREIQAEENK